MKKRLFGLIAVVAATSCVASAEVVTNGDFWVNYYDYSQGVVDFTPTHGYLPGWTVDDGSVDLVCGAYWQAPGSAMESIDMNGSDMGSLSQQLSLRAGSKYVLSFYVSANPYRDGLSKHLELTIDGHTQLYTVDKSDISYRDMKWKLETYSFKATSDTATLRFASLDAGSPFGPAIGAVHCEAVPEPITLSLCAGALGLALARRRRQK